MDESFEHWIGVAFHHLGRSGCLDVEWCCMSFNGYNSTFSSPVHTPSAVLATRHLEDTDVSKIDFHWMGVAFHHLGRTRYRRCAREE